MISSPTYGSVDARDDGSDSRLLLAKDLAAVPLLSLSQPRSPVRSWLSRVWEPADLPDDERRLLRKVDASLLVFAGLGYMLKSVLWAHSLCIRNHSPDLTSCCSLLDRNLDQVRPPLIHSLPPLPACLTHTFCQTNLTNAFFSGLREDLGMWENELVTAATFCQSSRSCPLSLSFVHMLPLLARRDRRLHDWPDPGQPDLDARVAARRHPRCAPGSFLGSNLHAHAPPLSQLELGWGLATLATYAVKDVQTLYCLRFLVGLFESGVRTSNLSRELGVLMPWTAL